MNIRYETIKDISLLLRKRGQEATELRRLANKVKLETVGGKVYLRGLIEFSNICQKNCFYCGIRRGNQTVHRYTLSREEVLAAARFAHKEGFGSVVLQSGERTDEVFVAQIEELVDAVMQESHGELGVTLSLGEQSSATYARWKKAGASRYLLRIETSDAGLYTRLHPADHSFQQRLDCLVSLRETGYQVGSGIMIGLPGQSVEQIAADLLFLKKIGVDMVGMGPYIEHRQTPLWEERQKVPSLQERYDLSLNAWAVLRLLMPDINIAATTAIGSISSRGRQEAIYTAANVIMPNLTPYTCRKEYFLYENKICLNENNEDGKADIERLIRAAGSEPGYFQQGDSLYFVRRQGAGN